ncbi:MAG: amino acid adenylation domain-containing protein, partial [Rhodococcus sp. (in: high G+C Gram-positive bacteria)]|uniref:non-ribosomal peptide synthetase n=1 Tax=Rhodococcus sp. TaxID=1831 RepID=UPI003BB06F7B
VRVEFEGNPAVYEKDELSGHHERFLQYFAGFVGAEEDTPIGVLPLLTADERDQLVHSSGPESVPPLTLPELFDATADSDGIALRYGDEDVSYRVLHERSNRLAHVLIEAGVGTGDRVALMLPRSVEQVVAVWAVARTGAAFVPVDPGYPAERIAHMITESGATMAIATDPSVVPAGIGWVDAKDQPGDSASVTDADRLRPIRVDNAAYVIYTSGSVGAPRGVTMTHRGLANHTAAVRRTYAVTSRSRVVACASPSFDASVHELLVALTAGATLVIAPPSVHGGRELAELLRRERVTHWTTTPAVPAMMDPDGLDHLEVIAVAGDVCPPDLVSRWSPGRTVLNLYGPTEVTIWATATAPLNAQPLNPHSPVTIGRPIEGVTALVLDRCLQPVPTGVVGELYLSGPGVGRGYLERPDVTSARFVANPFSRDCVRMYRTGDLVRWSKDGELEFVDRVDDQVKIRGFRVELGEITAVLGEYPGVHTAIAVTHERNGELMVDGYVHGAALDGAPLDPEDVIATVARRLPRYMVPATVTVLGSMPLTPSGKVDRAALPVPAPYERELRYWRDELRGAPPALPLPADRDPAAAGSAAGAVSFEVEAGTCRALEMLAQEQDSSLFTVVHAALAVMLSVVGNTDDLSIGAVIAERSEFGLGQSTDPLVLRSRLDPRATFTDFLARTHRTERAAVRHGNVPFERIVAAVGGGQAPDRHPLFQVLLTLDDDKGGDLAGLDLTVSVRRRVDDESGLDGEFVYSADRFDFGTVELWVQRLQRLLTVIAENPHVRLGSIDLLTA